MSLKCLKKHECSLKSLQERPFTNISTGAHYLYGNLFKINGETSQECIVTINVQTDDSKWIGYEIQSYKVGYYPFIGFVGNHIAVHELVM